MRDTVAKRRPLIDLEQFERRLRQPASPGRADDQALSELAKFVGRTEDPYKAVFEAPHAERPASAQQPYLEFDEAVWDEPQQESPRAASDGYAAVEAEFEPPAAEAQLEPNLHMFRSVDAPIGRWEENNESVAWPDEEEETRSRRPLFIMAAVIVAGIGGIGASFALKGGVAPHEIATIKAADGPVKVQPDAAAPAESASADASILNRTAQATPVAVADGTEQPVDLSRLPPHAPRAADAASVALPRSTQAAAAPSATEPQTIAGLIEPKKVKTVSVRPDGTVVANDKAAMTPPQAHAAAVAAPKPAAPKTTARVAAPAKPVQLADAQTGAAPAAAVPAASGGAFAVQLAAPQSEQEARDIQARLIKKFGNDIPGFHPSIRKAVSGDKTVYRVRTVGLSKEEATALCQKVQSTGGTCFVAKN